MLRWSIFHHWNRRKKVDERTGAKSLPASSFSLAQFSAIWANFSQLLDERCDKHCFRGSWPVDVRVGRILLKDFPIREGNRY